ncbi:hypothetical protein SESBI_22797 [Sesbania bispinosa]|nr:hypothetical protein SESBI_22797 [Sesbania bispinosa]
MDGSELSAQEKDLLNRSTKKPKVPDLEGANVGMVNAHGMGLERKTENPPVDTTDPQPAVAPMTENSFGPWMLVQKSQRRNPQIMNGDKGGDKGDLMPSRMMSIMRWRLMERRNLVGIWVRIKEIGPSKKLGGKETRKNATIQGNIPNSDVEHVFKGCNSKEAAHSGEPHLMGQKDDVEVFNSRPHDNLNLQQRIQEQDMVELSTDTDSEGDLQVNSLDGEMVVPSSL